MTALVVYLQNTLARLREREGQTMAEYALILGGIAILVIAGILILGPAVRDLFKDTGSSVQNFPTGSSGRTMQTGGGLAGQHEAPKTAAVAFCSDSDQNLSETVTCR